MKVKSLSIKMFKGLRDFNIDFNDDVTVLIGENGTGKTTILETVYNLLTSSSRFEGVSLKIEFNDSELKAINNLNAFLKEHPLQKLDVLGGKDTFYDLEDCYKYEGSGNIIYLPTEINFKKYKVESIKKYNSKKQFGEILSSNEISENLKNYLVYQHYRDLEDKESGKKTNRIKKYKELYNSFFEDKEFIGIKDLEPLFKIKATGETHSVDELSSGEKQIFFRAGSILEYELDNSIILIDEPEISMHPEWQQKILDFYRKIAGASNQLIIATHSPHIISSCKKEEVRALIKDEDKIRINENIEGTYGRTVEQLLLSLFDLKSVRYEKIQIKLDEFKKLYTNKDALSEGEKKKLENIKNELYKYLDPNDPELSLADMDDATERLKKLMNELKVN